MGSGGVQANSFSTASAISADGGWVAFTSFASNLVAGDTNGVVDVFVHDRQTFTTTRVSVGPAGVQGNGASHGSAISADGRWVVFSSWASNLVAGDTYSAWSDVFVHDRQTGTTTRVSAGPGGVRGNGNSSASAISADGQWVVFTSEAANLVTGDTNRYPDVFLHDRQTATTTRVSVGPTGAQGNDHSKGSTMSADGRWVAYYSWATNLVAGDTNSASDVFVYDRQSGTTTRASVASGGFQGDAFSVNGGLSADGRWVTFYSYASNLVAGDTNGTSDVFVHDRQTGITTRASLGPGNREGNGRSWSPAVSDDGRWVVFESEASNLVANDTNDDWDVLLRDRIDPTCNVTLAPASATASAGGTTSAVQVTAPSACVWTAASNDAAWLTVTGGSGGTGSGPVGYSVATNTGAPRTGSITIWDQRFTVHQVSATIPETPTGLVTAALAGNLVTLRWTIPPVGPAPTDFLLEGGVVPGQVLASIPLGSTAPAFTFTAPSGSFYVRVHAISGAFRSAASNEIRIHVNARVAPWPPQNPVALVNGSSLTLAWTNSYGGGEPERLWLGVGGAYYGGWYMPVTDHLTFDGVPPGTYSLALWAQNAAGNSLRSKVLTVTLPGPCTGPPDMPADVSAYRVGRTVFVTWAPGAIGAAPTSYVLNVTGSYVGGLATSERSLTGTVPPGSYSVSVVAVNPCGPSPGTAPQTVVVP